MAPSLSELLKLPAGERAELAMALWESLSDNEREAQLELTPAAADELEDRDDRVRIITARPVTPAERRNYEQEPK